MIARVEAGLDVRLLNRLTRSVSLTEKGRRFHERIAPLLVEMQEAAQTVSKSRTAVEGRLRLNVDPLFSRVVLAHGRRRR